MIGRALALTALLVRGQLEAALPLAHDPADAEAYQSLAQRLSRWLNDQDFTAHFTADELDALSAPPGAWTPAQHEAQSARQESLGVLLWALSLGEKFAGCTEDFPPPDLQALIGWPANGVMAPHSSALEEFPHNGDAMLQGVTHPRPVESLAAQRAATECWQWRANLAATQRAQPVPPPGHDYAMLIGIAAEEAHAAGVIGRPVSHDFPVNGRPFAKLPENLQTRCGELAATRRVALDWLCGYATPWDAVLVAV